jgi:hypothetical protein
VDNAERDDVLPVPKTNGSRVITLEHAGHPAKSPTNGPINGDGKILLSLFLVNASSHFLSFNKFCLLIVINKTMLIPTRVDKKKNIIILDGIIIKPRLSVMYTLITGKEPG